MKLLAFLGGSDEHLPPIKRSHLSGDGLFIPLGRGRNSMPRCAHSPHSPVHFRPRPYDQRRPGPLRSTKRSTCNRSCLPRRPTRSQRCLGSASVVANLFRTGCGGLTTRHRKLPCRRQRHFESLHSAIAHWEGASRPCPTRWAVLTSDRSTPGSALSGAVPRRPPDMPLPPVRGARDSSTLWSPSAWWQDSCRTT